VGDPISHQRTLRHTFSSNVSTFLCLGGSSVRNVAGSPPAVVVVGSDGKAEDDDVVLGTLGEVPILFRFFLSRRISLTGAHTEEEVNYRSN
jgi:hypothetical protein